MTVLRSLKPAMPKEPFVKYDVHSDASPIQRIVVCGNVDDGKSTLISRILARPCGVAYQNGLGVVDGLAAEQETGVTMDVGYYSCEWQGWPFTLIDAPGHGEYLGNMAAGATHADSAVIMIDVTNGITDQTKRHSAILSFMGIHNIIVAVNKMDMAGYNRQVFEQICDDYQKYVETLGFVKITAVPLSALRGDNIHARSPHMPWYGGDALLEIITNHFSKNKQECHADFAMPIQFTMHDKGGDSHTMGEVATGEIAKGADVMIFPAGEIAQIKNIAVNGVPSSRIYKGQAATITLNRDVPITRGCVMVARDKSVICANILDVTILWVSQTQITPCKPYIFKVGSDEVICDRIEITDIYVHDVMVDAAVKNGAHHNIAHGDMVKARIYLKRNIACLPYNVSAMLGGFILIDPQNHDTLAMGKIESGRVDE